MEIIPSSDHYRHGEPINVKVIVTNVSDQTVMVTFGPIDEHSHPFRLEVFDAAKHPVFKQEKPPVVDGLVDPPNSETPEGRSYPIKPGESSTYTVNLAEIYGLTEPGTYLVRGRVFSRNGSDWIRSNSVTISVD